MAAGRGIKCTNFWTLDRKLVFSILWFLLVSAGQCFVVDNTSNVVQDSGRLEESAPSTSSPIVLVGDFSISPLNKTQDSQDKSNCSAEEEHKIEQLLWDIFVDEDDDFSNDEEETPDNSPSSDEKYSERNHDSESESTFEEMLSESIAEEHDHKISRRSAEERRKANTPRPRGNKRQSSSKKQPQSKKPQKVSSRGHSAKKSSVSKYNEYMDVVLKRMNTMIKTKRMDPLMVNLFSGQGQQQGKQKKKPEAGKKKKKSGAGKKKRKGGKGRMEEVEEIEARSGSSDSDSSDVELDNEHDDGVTGVGGVFIRRVGVVEDSGEEDEDFGGEEIDSDRVFREIRALIVNGSMKRSTSESGSNGTKAASPSTAVPESTTKATEPPSSTSAQETRGFDKAASSAPVTSSEESPRKKQNKPEKNQGNKPSKKKPAATKRSRATRGVLKGLSSLKRNGDVDVVRQSDSVRVVRGRFTLGPVTLEIVPKGGKGGAEEGRGKKGKKPKTEEKPDPPKVTAIARELKGIIEVRLKKHSPTTIKRLRVFPPSSVKIKSSNKKPKTKETVPRYNRVTPVATHRLRQIASAVVRQADVKRKSSGLEGSRSSGGKKSGSRP